jgi:hypothetical protein
MPQSWRIGKYHRCNANWSSRIISIHNTYLLASGWKIVADNLIQLQEDGLTDNDVPAQLKASERLRARFMTLYDMVNTLVETMQNRFSFLATLSRKIFPHLR